MKIRIEIKLGTILWTHQDGTDNEVFSLYLSNVNELDIVDKLTVYIYSIYS